MVGRCGALLAPLADAIGKHVKAALKIHADDIPIPVLSPGNGKTKTGRLWVYVRDDRPWADPAAPAVWFMYSPDRKGERPLGHLKDYHGILLGSRTQTLLRALGRRRLPDRTRGARADPGIVRDRSADPRSLGR